MKGTARDASKIQEAIDTIVQAFDHPVSISLEHTIVDGEKQTRFEVTTDSEVVCYELRYDGLDETAEPELVVVD
jgi:hypothetical protein